MQATTECLNVPPRDKRDVAIERARAALTVARRRLARIAATCGVPNAIEACRLNVREAEATGRDIAATLADIDALLGKGEGE